MRLVGRAGLCVLLTWWGLVLSIGSIEGNDAGESFLHHVNLPFHEAGHLLFMPFGQLLMFAGGSLGQVLMPLICAGTLLIRTRDPFGASVALWWVAENCLDIAPYVNDARSLELVLLGGVTGKETDGHDWNNILTMLGWLQHDHRLAQAIHYTGIVLMGLSLLWGAVLLVRHYRRYQAMTVPSPDGRVS
ncbi:hypothetical protein W02_22690 [Nitrospira sp. KM1]|nr:hypothetical protein W02_22690 [Nitrospira sp. KM1]